MKRIIALALTILLGSTGYVIVDHTIENRVGVLESQVESLNGVVSSLEDEHALEYIPTTSIINTSNTYSAGDAIPLAGAQKTEFNLHYVKGYTDSNYLTEVFYDTDYNTNYSHSLYNVIEEKDYKVNLTDLSFTVFSSETIGSFDTENYTTSSYTYDRIVIAVKAKGVTAPELAGRKISFSMIYDKSNSNSFFESIDKESYHVKINDDGSFDLDVKYTYSNRYSSLGTFKQCYLVNPQIHK